MMKRVFELPRIDIMKFDTEDVITTSVITPNVDGGSVAFPESWNNNADPLAF